MPRISKTQELKKIIVRELNKLEGDTYYRRAPDTASFPYKVYNFTNIDLNDFNKDTVLLSIDLWDSGIQTANIDNIADEIENLFNNANFPNDKILPTFFKISRYPVDDEDKTLQRIQLKFEIQIYYIGE